MTNLDTLKDETLNYLKAEFEQSEEFQKELEGLTHFYGRKIAAFAKTEDHMKFIEDNLGDIVSSQYFQGYYVMKNILADQEGDMPEEMWKAAKGVIRNEVPLLFNNIFKDQPEWHKTELSHAIGIKLVQMIDGIYDLLRQMRKDLSLYGAYKAFIEDERYTGPTVENESTLYFADSSDIHFLNPQVFMSAQFKTNEHEIWDLYNWSSVQENNWVGSIHLSSLPMDATQVIYVLEVKLSETIIPNERYEMLKEIINMLPSSIQSFMQTRLYHVSELEVVVPKI